MNHFGVSAVRWNASRTEIDACLVHGIDRANRGFNAAPGEEMTRQDVSSLINRGDVVLTLRLTANGAYDRGEKILVKAGQIEYLGSYDESGRPTQFHGLPEF